MIINFKFIKKKKNNIYKLYLTFFNIIYKYSYIVYSDLEDILGSTLKLDTFKKLYFFFFFFFLI